MPELFIDADACPVKKEIYKATGKYGTKVFVVANSFMNMPLDNRIELVVVDDGPDEADNWIAEHVAPCDIVITADIPLADRCVKKGARVMDHKGKEFTPDSIGSALAMRDLMDHLRSAGEMSGGPPPFSKNNRSNFISKLHEVLQAAGNSEN